MTMGEELGMTGTFGIVARGGALVAELLRAGRGRGRWR
jgi:hypothetical protein